MSQKEGTQTRIGEHEYLMYMLPPMVSHDLLIDVAKMVGPALGPVLDALFSKAEGADFSAILGQEIGTEFFSKAASAIFGGLDKKVLKDVIKEFRGVTFVDGKPLDPIFDFHFQGELGDLHHWLVWGMKVQWGKSFRALRNVAALQGVRGPAANDPAK